MAACTGAANSRIASGARALIARVSSIVGRAAGQDEAAITIAAIGKAGAVDLDPHPRMAITTALIAVAKHASGIGNVGFGGRKGESARRSHAP